MTFYMHDCRRWELHLIHSLCNFMADRFSGIYTMLAERGVSGIHGSHISMMQMLSSLSPLLARLIRYDNLTHKYMTDAYMNMQYLEEDGKVNRIHDSLQLFTYICANPLLKSVHLVLFLSTFIFFYIHFSDTNADRVKFCALFCSDKTDILKAKIASGVLVKKQYACLSL